MPAKTLDLEPLVRRDGFRTINTYYVDKDIEISGTVTYDTEADLLAGVTAMKKALSVTEANLDIDDGGTTVRWVATVSSISIPEQHYHITRLPYSIVFKCQPFGKKTTSTTSTNSIVNTSSATNSVVVAGSAVPRPVVTWTVSGTPSSAITVIAFTNNTTSDTFSVSGLSLVGDGDYLELDTENMTVVYNTGSGEVTTDFTGVIPDFVTSTNSYTTVLTGGGATKTISQSIVYYESYL